MTICFLEGVDPATTTREIFDVIHKHGQIIDIEMNVETFNNKKICLDSAFVSAVADFSLKEPVFIHGREVRPVNLSARNCPAKAILLGDSARVTPEMLRKAIDFRFQLSRRHVDDSFCYILQFETAEKRDAAVEKFSAVVIANSVFSLRPYAVYPKPSYAPVSGLKRIQAAGSGTLQLVHQGVTWKVNPHLAALVSETLKRHLERKGVDQQFVVAPIAGDFTPVYELLWHRPYAPPEGQILDYKFLFLMGAHLNIPYLTKALEGSYYVRLTLETALEGIAVTRVFGHGMEPHICFLASHINSCVDHPEFKKLPLEVLRAIFSSPHFDGTKDAIERMKTLVGGEDLRCYSVVRRDNNPQFAKDLYRKWVASESVDLNAARSFLSELNSLPPE